MIRLMYALCLLFSPGRCVYDQAHVTHYCPELGGVNGMPPYDITASGRIVEPGVTAACGSEFPFGTRTYIQDVGWRTCWDRGGAILGHDIDVLIGLEQCQWIEYQWEGETRLWCANWRSGDRPALWVLPHSDPPIDTHRAMCYYLGRRSVCIDRRIK